MLALLVWKWCIYFPSWILGHVDSKTTLGSSQNCIYVAGKLWDTSTRRFPTEGECQSPRTRDILLGRIFVFFVSFLPLNRISCSPGGSPTFSVAPGDLELLLIYFWAINFWSSPLISWVQEVHTCAAISRPSDWGLTLHWTTTNWTTLWESLFHHYFLKELLVH